MFQHFPKINYGFSGGTFEVTNIFKSINVSFDRPDAVLTTPVLPGERPEQLSNRLYQDSQYYWALFLANGIKNPFREWAQSQESYISQIESEYPGWMYQFGNTSVFLPLAGSTGFTGTVLNHYDGTDLDDILPGDVITYETGSGPYSIKCYGAGGVSGANGCGTPQHGQSIVPPQFNYQQAVKQVAAGDNFTACLDTRGYVYAWGNIDLSGSPFTKSGNLYTSNTNGYTFIDASGKRIVAVTTANRMQCFGDCSDFNSSSAASTTNVIKTSWSSDNSGGVAIQTGGTAVGYGTYTPPSSLQDVNCGYGYCVGVLPTTLGLTAFGADAGNNNLVVPSFVTGVTAISVANTHALAVTNDGALYAWGNDSDGQVSETPATGTYKKVSAGHFHSAAINSDGSLRVWGKIAVHGTTGSASCSGVVLTKVTPTQIDGVFSNLASGYNHIVLQGSGTNKKYIGVVDFVDSVYKRVFVKTYQFPDTEPVVLADPSGTVVSIWRYNDTSGRYEQVKVIQHQLLGIIKYLDSTKYIKQGGLMMGVDSSSWENIYLEGYDTANDNSEFITPRKELLDIDLYNKSQIKQISLSGVKNLETSIKSLFKTNTTNEIKVTDL